MKLLSLDFDGVLHSATDPVFINNFRSQAPAWQIEVSLKAQGRFVWAQALADAIESCNDSEMAVVIHSTWRYKFSDKTLRSFLPAELGRRVIELDGHLDRQVDTDHYLAAALDLIAPQTVCVLDDRPEVFLDGRVQQWIQANAGVVIACVPARGVTDGSVSAALSAWCKAGPRHEPVAPGSRS